MSKPGYQDAPSGAMMSRDELVAKLERTVERAGQNIAESRARQTASSAAHEQWRQSMKTHRDEMERRRLAGTDVHGVRLGKFRGGQFFAFDNDRPVTTAELERALDNKVGKVGK